jgi:hypothetical protein
LSYVLLIEHTTGLPIRTYIALYPICPLPYLRTAYTPIPARDTTFRNVKGELLISKALAKGLYYKARYGVRLFPFGFRLELDSFLYRTY